MTFDGWVDHLLREILEVNVDDWFRVSTASASGHCRVDRIAERVIIDERNGVGFINNRNNCMWGNAWGGRVREGGIGQIHLRNVNCAFMHEVCQATEGVRWWPY